MILRSREEAGGLRWEGRELLPYKESGTHFRKIAKQNLFGSGEGLPSELRYFEIAPEGHSTLERHEHVHGVLILRGEGEVLVGDRVSSVRPFDLVYVPPRTWHQFRPAPGSSLGFLCLVDAERDRPERPDAAALEELRRDPAVAAFIRV